jgi:hypothetical protein
MIITTKFGFNFFLAVDLVYSDVLYDLLGIASATYGCHGIDS